MAAAASLRRVMPELERAWRAEHPGEALTFTFGGSGELRRQVETGAPIDAVVFAHPEPVASLVAQGRVRSGSERDVARNTLVLVGRRATDRRDGARRTLRTLGALPEGAWLAIGEPRTVPAGKYAQALLESLGLWESLSGRMVFAKDVSAVLTYVRRGEAEVGLVYRTDVIDLDDVEVLDAPAGEVSGANARYVAAAVSPRAKAFVDFVATAPGARAIWTRHGFGAP